MHSREEKYSCQRADIEALVITLTLSKGSPLEGHQRGGAVTIEI